MHTIKLSILTRLTVKKTEDIASSIEREKDEVTM